MKNINNMTGSEEYILHQEIAEKALDNAYRLIIGKVTLEELFDEAEESVKEIDKQIYLPFDPEKAIPEDCIEILIEHFIYHEEYEKCAELVKSQKLINETYEMIEQNKKRVDNG